MRQPNEPFRNQPNIEEPRHLEKDFGVLLSIIADITSELDLDELLSKIAHHIVNLCDADGGSIFLVDDTGKVIKQYHHNVPDIMSRSEIPYGKGVFYKVIVDKQTVIVNDYPSYQLGIQSFADAGVKAFLATPIAHKGNTIGAMWVFNTSKGRTFTNYHAKLLKAVALQAGVAIENARLYEVQRKNQEKISDALRSANVLLEAANIVASSLDIEQILQKLSEMVAEITGYKRNIIFLDIPEEHAHKVVAVSGNGVAIDTRYTCETFGAELCAVREATEPVTLDRSDAGLSKAAQATMDALNIKRAILVPLAARGKSFGSIAVDDPGKETSFSKNEIRLVSALAKQTSVTIDNARLFARLRDSTSELEVRGKDMQTLLEVTLDTTAGLRLDELLPRIAKNAAYITNADVGAVGLINEATGSVTYRFIYNLPEVIATVEIPPGSGMSGIVISNRKSLIVPDYQKLKEKLEPFAAAGLRAIAMVPLWLRDKIIGTLWVSSKNPEKQFDSRDIAILEGLGRHAAIALEKARLYEGIQKSEEEARRRARELAILNSLSNKLSQTLELDTLLNTAIDSVKDLLEADGAAIFLLNEERQKLYLAAHRGLGDYFVEHSKVIPIDEGLPDIVAETNAPVVVENLAEHPEFEATMVQEAFTSLVGAPIKSKRRVVGVLAFGSRWRSEFTHADATLLEAIGSELGVALENSRLYEAQRHISESLQRSMLPLHIPAIPNMDIGVQYSSATEEALVGGDFYDIFETHGKYALVIGDVSGKGIEASSSTSMIKYVLQSYLYLNPSPAFAFTEANKVVGEQLEPGGFITAFCAVYDPDTGLLTFVNAGHPYPCLLDQINKTCAVLSTDDPAVGIIEGHVYSENSVTMHRGNIFTAFTDGVLETRHNSDFFGEKRLIDVLIENLEAPAQSIADAIIKACFDFSKGHLTDDIAILIIRRIR